MANKKSTIDATINLIFGLAVIILFFLVFYIHLAFHELGHLMAVNLVRFKLFSYKIGPFGWGVGIFTVLINVVPFSNKGFKTDGLLAR